MGVPNLEIPLTKKDQNSMEVNTQVKPNSGLGDDESIPKVAPNLQELDHEEKRVEKQEQEEPEKEAKAEEEEEDRLKLLESKLEVKLPSPKESRLGIADVEEEEEEDGFKTPTSEEHKIPVLLECPPAPRPRAHFSKPVRKCIDRRILPDHQLSIEIKSFFCSTPGSGQNKRVRRGYDSDSDPK